MKAYSSCRTAVLAGLLMLLSFSAEAQYRRGFDRRDYRNYPSRQDRVVVYRHDPRTVVIHRPVPYRYYAPPAYRHYGPRVIITPSIGVHTGTLPFGCRPVWIGPRLYFYSGGTFYRRADRDYEVVNAPVGAEVPDLPERARVVVIDNNKYYELDGTFYRETVRANGEIWYTVTGKEGDEVVNLPQNEGPAVGDVLTSLPAGCKVIVLNNQKYFISPGGTYYQELIENNQIFYKVAGTPE